MAAAAADAAVAGRYDLGKVILWPVWVSGWIPGLTAGSSSWWRGCNPAWALVASWSVKQFSWLEQEQALETAAVQPALV